MGKEAFIVHRHQGRFFWRYKPGNGLPKSLGENLISRIPSNPDRYRVWLEWERVRHAEIAERLQRQTLVYTYDEIDGAHPRTQLHKGLNDCENYCDHIDCRQIPDYIYNKAPATVYGAWNYLIDLDNEILVIKINKDVKFRLQELPRDRLIAAMKWQEFDHESSDEEQIDGNCSQQNDDRSRRFDLETFPGAFIRVGVPFHSWTSIERRQLLASRERYRWSIVTVSDHIFSSVRNALTSKIASILFGTLAEMDFWHQVEDEYLSDTVFRETSFAVLSLALGNFYLDQPSAYHNFVRSCRKGTRVGCLLGSNETQFDFLPLFGSGCRMEDKLPGCAPAESVYWLGEVLISLVPQANLHDDVDVAIAELLIHHSFGKRSSFQFILFSIKSVVLGETYLESSERYVRHTQPLVIRNTTSDTSNFVILQNFFETAAHRRLPRSGSNLPRDIMSLIVNFTDAPTRQTCAAVSYDLRQICHRQLTLSHDIIAVAFEPLPQAYRSIYEEAPGMLLLKSGDKSIVRHIIAPMNYFAGWDRTTWCPVFGTPDRPAIFTDLQLRTRMESEKMKKKKLVLYNEVDLVVKASHEPGMLSETTGFEQGNQANIG